MLSNHGRAEQRFAFSALVPFIAKLQRAFIEALSLSRLLLDTLHRNKISTHDSLGELIQRLQSITHAAAEQAQGLREQLTRSSATILMQLSAVYLERGLVGTESLPQCEDVLATATAVHSIGKLGRVTGLLLSNAIRRIIMDCQETSDDPGLSLQANMECIQSSLEAVQYRKGVRTSIV
jgi:hypothetical protein